MAATPPDLSVRPLRRTEYDRMVDQGMFVDEHIELLDGALVEMSPEGPEHSWLVQELTHALVRGLPEDLRVRIGHPWAASEISEPEPDLAVVPRGDYRHAHADRAVLIVEVSHSSLGKDLGRKPATYAAASVPVYWVVDLRDRCVHVHTAPSLHGYRRVVAEPFDVALDAAGVPVRIVDLLRAP